MRSSLLVTLAFLTGLSACQREPACIAGTECPSGCFAIAGFVLDPAANCVRHVDVAVCSGSSHPAWMITCAARVATGDLFAVMHSAERCESCEDFRGCTEEEQGRVWAALNTPCQ